MRILKASIVALASLFAVSTVQAASFSAPVSKPIVGSSIELAAEKKPAKKAADKKAAKPAKAKSKKKASKAGKCGTFMYSKKGKCMDARDKK